MLHILKYEICFEHSWNNILLQNMSNWNSSFWRPPTFDESKTAVINNKMILYETRISINNSNQFELSFKFIIQIILIILGITVFIFIIGLLFCKRKLNKKIN